MSIRWKLLIPFLSIIALAMILIESLSFINAKKTVHVLQLELIGQTERMRVLDFFETKKRLAQAFAGDGLIRLELERLTQSPDSLVRDDAAQRLITHLQSNQKSQDSDLIDVDLLDLNGVVVASSRAAAANELAALFQEIVRGDRRQAVVHYLPDLFDDLPSIAVSTPIKSLSSDLDLGVLVNVYRLRSLSDGLLGELSAGRSGPAHESSRRGFLVDENGDFVAQSRPSSFSGFLMDAYGNFRTQPADGGMGGRPHVKASEILKAHRDLQGGAVLGVPLKQRIGPGGELIWQTAREIPLKDDLVWALVVEQRDDDEAITPINQLWGLAMATVLITLLIVAFVALSIARTISKPIQELAHGAEIIGKGDLSHRVGTDDKDEVGVLSRAIDRMANDLQTLIDELRQSESEVRALNQTLEQRVEARTAELAREQYLLNTLVDNIPDPVFFKDRQSRFIRANVAMARTGGLATPDEVLGKTDAEVWTPEFGQQTLADEQRIMATGEPIVNKEERTVLEDGSESWGLVTKMPLRDEVGNIVGTFGTARDITHIKRHEQELAQLNAELQQTNKELDEFAYVASHDLRSPLRAIDNLTKWMAEDEGNSWSEQSAEDLRTLRARVAKMEGLLNGLLQYSRIGRKNYEATTIDCHGMVEEIAALLDLPAGFTIEVAERMPKLHAQRVPLEQVLRNLIDNAIKHHDRAEGRIVITARSNGQFVEFSVVDDGPGIAPEYQQQIFQIFETIKTHDDVEGSGMGLALVRKTVEIFGGRITLESKAGAGATFRFTWPKGAGSLE